MEMGRKHSVQRSVIPCQQTAPWFSSQYDFPAQSLPSPFLDGCWVCFCRDSYSRGLRLGHSGIVKGGGKEWILAEHLHMVWWFCIHILTHISTKTLMTLGESFLLYTGGNWSLGMRTHLPMFTEEARARCKFWLIWLREGEECKNLD